MSEISDANLVRRSAEGDPDAFIGLLQRHAQSLAALIRRLVPDADHAEDVFQETLIEAWRGLGRLRQPEKVKAWLLQVARNRCRDFWKSSQRRDCPTEQPELEVHVNRYGRAAGQATDRTAEVVEALDDLPPANGEVAKLFYLAGLSISEISERIQRPEGTVKRRLFEARHHLRRHFGVSSEEEANDE